MLFVCSSRRMESFVFWSLRGLPARGLNNFISVTSILRLCEAASTNKGFNSGSGHIPCLFYGIGPYTGPRLIASSVHIIWSNSSSIFRQSGTASVKRPAIDVYSLMTTAHYIYFHIRCPCNAFMTLSPALRRQCYRRYARLLDVLIVKLLFLTLLTLRDSIIKHSIVFKFRRTDLSYMIYTESVRTAQ
jgi:hypothetical protein